MFFSTTTLRNVFATYLIGGVASVGMVCAEGGSKDDLANIELQRRVEKIERQNETLRASYIQSIQEAKSARDQLNEARQRLEMLGATSLKSSEERLVYALSEAQRLNDRIKGIEEASVRFSGSVMAYMREAVLDNPESRASVEVCLRELDSQLGLRGKPVAQNTGTLQEARVVSIDANSGLLILNVGRSSGARIGAEFGIYRSDRRIGKSIITEVRNDISGALVQQLVNATDSVKLGDSVAIQTMNQ